MSAIANGQGLTFCRITVPWRGPMIVSAAAPDEVTPVGGLVTFLMGNLTVVATLVPERSGMFAGSWRGDAVGGRNGWSKPVTAKGYNSPFGVLNTQIFADAALSVGELPPVVQAPAMVGGFYVRLGGGDHQASQVFDLLGDGIDWWIDGAGITQVGPRLPTVVSSPFDLIDNDTARGKVTIATDDPASFVPGATFIDPLAGAFTVNAAVWTVTENKTRGEIWIA